ncbi:MAG TPA: DUF3747 domain-containing protein [Oscillatoriaceae cyanobacterium M33_DOE_052]|uniref:DUF3747 domain-containing protein n=1 Tax=Planktothricoides sp. SpSt-374 TaxID=2282167 RepID=A0A7C3VMD1_9CYAN|nr:DUF3747 domain-containing protein [Oscillatoriaceae cyanobacterium M33_DOE_052]
MKNWFRSNIAGLTTAAVFSMSAIGALTHRLEPAAAALFGKQEVNQNEFIAVAIPRGTTRYGLVIIEQQSSQRRCWSESGSNPTNVDLLLLTFDFTGICGRSTDSNGYSLRVSDEDLGLTYTLRLVNRGNEVVLIGDPSSSSRPQIEIGRTFGIPTGPTKIVLDPTWRFTKRTYEGKTLGHVYLTNNQTLAALGAAAGSTPTPTPTPTPRPTTPPTASSKFSDIAGDVYRNEIEGAVALGFVAGVNETTFGPVNTLTREQIVSMVVEALVRLPGINLNVPSQASVRPYPDVVPTRWSAAKIQFARDNGIISGYRDGTFRPTQEVTRAELMAILQKATLFAKQRLGMSSQISAPNSPTSFSDTSGHWAAATIGQMSGYCKVASPLNEVGSAFFPNSSARRNYAAAATLRMINCIKADK